MVGTCKRSPESEWVMHFPMGVDRELWDTCGAKLLRLSGRCGHWPTPVHSLAVATNPGAETIVAPCLHLWHLPWLLYPWSYRLQLFNPLQHSPRLGPVFCEHVESKSTPGNDLLPLWWAHAFPVTPSTVLHQTPQYLHGSQSSPLSEVWVLKPEPTHCPQPPLTAGMWAASQLGSTVPQQSLWWIFSALPSDHLSLNSSLQFPLRFWSSPITLLVGWGGWFPSVWKLFLIHDFLPRAQVTILKSFASLFIFIFCPISFWGG